MEKGRFFRAALPRDLGGDMPYSLGLPMRMYGDLFFSTTYIGPSVVVPLTTKAVFNADVCTMVWEADLTFGSGPLHFLCNIRPWTNGEGLDVLLELQPILVPTLPFQSHWRWHVGNVPIGNFLRFENLELIDFFDPTGGGNVVTPALLPVVYGMEP
jgi:hypothetical protein